MQEIKLDGHTWTDRGDGLYLPDIPYQVNIEEFWGLGKEFGDKTFLLKDTSTQGIYTVIAMTYKSTPLRVILTEQQHINNSGEHAITRGGCNPSRMEIVEYVIQENR